jgi:hypothetical protein
MVSSCILAFERPSADYWLPSLCVKYVGVNAHSGLTLLKGYVPISLNPAITFIGVTPLLKTFLRS